MTAELRCLTVRIDTGRWQETVLAEVDLMVPRGQITAVASRATSAPRCGRGVKTEVMAGRIAGSTRLLSSSRTRMTVSGAKA